MPQRDALWWHVGDGRGQSQLCDLQRWTCMDSSGPRATSFKTVVTEDLGQGGSIPLRLRYLQVCAIRGSAETLRDKPKEASVDFAWT